MASTHRPETEDRHGARLARRSGRAARRRNAMSRHFGRGDRLSCQRHERRRNASSSRRKDAHRPCPSRALAEATASAWGGRGARCRLRGVRSRRAARASAARRRRDTAGPVSSPAPRARGGRAAAPRGSARARAQGHPLREDRPPAARQERDGGRPRRPRAQAQASNHAQVRASGEHARSLDPHRLQRLQPHHQREALLAQEDRHHPGGQGDHRRGGAGAGGRRPSQRRNRGPDQGPGSGRLVHVALPLERDGQRHPQTEQARYDLADPRLVALRVPRHQDRRRREPEQGHRRLGDLALRRAGCLRASIRAATTTAGRTLPR